MKRLKMIFVAILSIWLMPTVCHGSELFDLAVCKVDTIAVSESLAQMMNSVKIKPHSVNPYNLPYSRDANFPDYKRLWVNTGVLCMGGVAALGVLQLLPEESTAWNKKELEEIPLFKRWGNHVSDGPVWDGDNWVFNFVLHPYGGAAYYMSARSLGFNMLYSSVYCFCISTIFWEYGIEAFMEIPSIQDLVITPIIGSLLGECFYKWKRKIVSDGYRLYGSSILGNIVAFLLDPVNEFVGLFMGNPSRTGVLNSLCEISSAPWLGGGYCGVTIGCRF